MIGFAAFERYALRRRRSTAWAQAGLVVAGFAAAILIYAASWTTIGPWDLTNDATLGPPPGTEEARLVDTGRWRIREEADANHDAAILALDGGAEHAVRASGFTLARE